MAAWAPAGLFINGMKTLFIFSFYSAIKYHTKCRLVFRIGSYLNRILKSNTKNNAVGFLKFITLLKKTSCLSWPLNSRFPRLNWNSEKRVKVWRNPVLYKFLFGQPQTWNHVAPIQNLGAGSNWVCGWAGKTYESWRKMAAYQSLMNKAKQVNWNWPRSGNMTHCSKSHHTLWNCSQVNAKQHH